jgi:hypothetical protein
VKNVGPGLCLFRAAVAPAAGLKTVPRAVALALVAALAQAPPAAAAASEAEIKAAFLCQFGNYVEWPAATASAAEGLGFGIAIAGNELEADVLQRVAAAANVGGRPIRVRRLAAGESPRDERILYVTRSQAARAPELAPSAVERGMLLVTDAAEAGIHGSMVNFVTEDDKVRFDVDVAGASAARLKLSARLLSVARRVIGGMP